MRAAASARPGSAERGGAAPAPPEYLGKEDAAAGLAKIKGEGVDARHQIGAKGGMNRAVAGKARQGRKGGGAQDDGEMGLARFAPAGVAAVLFAVVVDFQPLKHKGSLKPGLKFGGNGHLWLCPLHTSAQCPKLAPPSRKGKP